jgi:serine/threonine protein kinase
MEKKRVLLNIFKQIVEGIEFIHSFGIIHSDIKHLNILIEDNGNSEFKAKIIDLGSAI